MPADSSGSGFPGFVDYVRLLDVLAVEVELTARTVHGSRLDAPVPACPGLTLGETVRHLGSVYRMARSWIAEGARPTHWQRAPDSNGTGSSGGSWGGALVDYLRSGLAELLPELSGHAPDDPCATWWPADRGYGFWARRLVHETTVHRTDVQSAAGVAVADIATDIALDGVDEVLRLWLGYRLSQLGVTGTRHGTVLVETDQYRWLVRADPAETAVRRLSAEAADNSADSVDAVVSANPVEMYLWLWGRRPLGTVRITGQDEAVWQMWALLRLATR
ncbi:uncharacterized protein (TIGR03083 family) [Tamaricihabitans halophyticus]|uniref:Uncharacterized protein (TIGR03083 family) n=1 Tax=Tamaricihabitans halophyticus TaxID=1262583 RepID=A0A4R2R6D4_9PSEU|nr:maleylpyruvate isomerase family mycothiol-dependent enzyme [Tamaricihabitans halophyticus]TCP55151.1 uncharacterized protein (TIGR03083 family) [Tamaricihabitans halophyticus]